MHVAHGEAAKAMQAYIRKIEEEAPEDESMEIQEGEQGGQQTITIAAEDGGEEQTVYQMSDGTYQAVVTDASHVSYLSCPSGQVKNTLMSLLLMLGKLNVIILWKPNDDYSTDRGDCLLTMNLEEAED